MGSALRDGNVRHTRAEQARLQSAQRELARAEEDYQRLRAAYLALAQQEHGNEVALAMVGADMDRAHAHLQELSGLRQLPFTQQPAAVGLRQAARLAVHDA